ncbi:MAG: hypothetical protein QOK10_1782 [Pseudonocardiales bacterium]|jgi:hypothetical protein|nr:hypothetical protein [Pseudonocardiales bacterium]
MATATEGSDRTLAEIVRAAATLVPKAARVIQQCTNSVDPGCELARACGEIASAYSALHLRLSDLPRTTLVDQVDRLLNYQLHLLVQASGLAFRPRGPGWHRVAANFGDGWGEPADELIRLAARL